MRIYVNEIKIKDDSIYCYSEDPTDGLDEVGQMLVDSDNFSFAYLLDDGSSYSYLIFVQETWSMLHNNRDKKVIKKFKFSADRNKARLFAKNRAMDLAILMMRGKYEDDIDI